MHWLRVVWVHARIGLQTDLQYRANFLKRIVVSALSLALFLGSILVIFQHTNTLGDWTRADLIMLVGVYMIVSGFIDFSIRPGLNSFMEGIRTGNFDYILLKPVDAQLYVCIQRLRAWNLVDLVMGAGLVVCSHTVLGLSVPPANVLLFLVALLVGFTVVLAFWFILGTLTFWFIRIENIFVVFDSLFETARWPVTIYPDFLRILLTFVIPVAWAVTFPATALTDRVGGREIGLAFLIPLGFVIAARLFWVRGLQHYAGASA